nr:hypothetical protein [Tanacetum cinerariifolium]
MAAEKLWICSRGTRKRLRRSFFETTKATKSNSVVACRQRARVVDSFDCSKKKHKIYQDVSDTPESAGQSDPVGIEHWFTYCQGVTIVGSELGFVEIYFGGTVAVVQPNSVKPLLILADFWGFFEKQKLTGPNFMDWYQQLRIVLSIEDKLNYLEQPIPPVSVAPRSNYPLHAHEMLRELKTLFGQQAEQELLQTTRDFQSCKQEEGQSFSSNALKMKGYIENIEHLGHPVTLGLGVSLILIDLRKEYDGFVQNYNMHSMGKTVNELHAMLKLHEQTLPKNNAPALHAIRAGKVQKVNKHKKSQTQMATRGQNHGKGKNKQAYAPKPKISPPHKRKDPAKDSICHECGETRHWKRNCPQYLAELLKKKRTQLQELVVQGLRASRKLKPEALSLYVGNDGFINCFVNNTIQVFKNNMVYFSVIPKDGIFKIDLSNSYTNESSIYDVSNKRAKLDFDYALLWHCRLGHISKKCIEKLQHDGLIDSSDLRDFEKCISCMSEKMARKPYTHQVKRAKDLLRLIHTDVCGPFKIMSRQRESYFVTFTDDFGRYGYVYLLKHKHEVFETFKVFQKEVENQLGKTIKSLRSDRRGEYMSQEFLDHLNDLGIIAHRTPPYTPQHNGVSERRNRTLLDMVRSMMSQITLLKSFWDYALETAARILNMVPTKKVEKIPYEVWHGKTPKLSYLKETMGYSFYYPPKNKVLVARNAEFLENSLINQEASGSLEDLKIIQEEDMHPSIDTSLNHEEDNLEINEPQSDIVPIRRSTRTRHAQDRMCLYIDAEEHELGDLGEPANYKAALLDHESKKWLNVMNVEMQSIKDNDVWVLVELPPNGKTVGSKWLFKKKTDMDRVVHTYKSRLVAKGYTQTPEIDYEETFSPFPVIRAIRILIAIAAYYDYEIWQMDVKTAFLNGYLNEEVYMEQPEGFVNPKYPNRKFGFTQNRDEPCVYLKASGSNITFLILYVDDILIMENNIPMLQSVKSYLGRCFAMKDLDEAAYILGIKIYRDRSRQLIGLCQSAYIEKILKRYCMDNSKCGSIPMQEKLKLHKSQGASTHAELKRMQNVYMPRLWVPLCDLYWTTVKNILKYLRNTKDMFLVYGEAEYIAAFDASKEAVWLRKFISGLGVIPIIEEPISMYCDNTRAIAIANESGLTKDARHFHVKVHYLREVIEYGDIKLEKVT